MQNLIRAADNNWIKLLLRLAVATHNVDFVFYVTVDNIMLPYYILYGRRAVAFQFYKVPLGLERFILNKLDSL